ncbi:SMP3 [Candida theae]|uniref:Mannosyltransferase n=1 Tax=Candida theae TaxID=1198502 RepID=A0AAD5FYC2_9ASCO|nr:SMP3 [Candida theae]KAI5957655.1 SMP3 [Candida theae]
MDKIVQRQKACFNLLLLTLSNSYIHPDEHFQSLEVLANKILGYETNIPWEFTDSSPARSYGPLHIAYAPILYTVRELNLDLSPLQIWYILRLQNCLVSWLVTDFCLYWMLPIKHERIKAVFFTSTSFVTLVFQNHLFSNSVETILLVSAIYIIDDLRYIQENPDLHSVKKTSSLFVLGVLVSIGVFNRITFPAFLILPGWYVVKYLTCHIPSIVPLALGFLVPSLAFVLFDTWMYDSKEYVITPMNNLLYNSNVENLKSHGLHPLYTHFVVNLPQILGPGLLFLISKRYWKTTPFLSAASGLLFLSLIPHQELRFLIPILPLCCCCFDLTQKWVSPYLIYVWYVFNLLMSILMGVFHQGGVVPVLNYVRENNLKGTHIWWHTYSPPSWILGSQSAQTIALDELDAGNKDFTLVDAMGIDIKQVEASMQRKQEPVYLITPIASFQKFDATKFRPIYNYTYHIDLDHLDLNNFHLGLGVYQLII